MRHARLAGLLASLVLWTGPAPAMAQQVTVATYECPPFVYRDDAGNLAGLSIELLDAVAARVGFDTAVIEKPLPAILEAMAHDGLDLAVSCISITAERELDMDFSHAFYETHLAIATRSSSLLSTLVNLLSSPDTLFWVSVLLAGAGVVGGLFYLLEHRINPKLYSRKTRAGRIVEGFILGLLFITRGPVNYYEFQTLTGRVVTVLLAILTTFFLASFTAVLASAFTVERLRSSISGPEDLRGLEVGVKAQSTAALYLDTLGISYQTYQTVPAMLERLNDGALDAVVSDDPVLRYLIKRGQEIGTYPRLLVLPYRFDRQNYGFVLTEDAALVEDINRAILEVRETDAWQSSLGRHLGTTR